jgi:hypothetical protein
MRIPHSLTAVAVGMLFIAGCDAGNGLDKVNGSVNVEPGAKVGSASTVNGSIDIGHDATVGSADTVNGAIDLGPHAHANSLETVNGGIQIESSAEVAKTATTVNGSLELAMGSHVGGRLENVNGAIKLDHANVDGGIETVNGDITVGSGSTVRSGLHVSKPHGLWIHTTRKPRIVIASGAVVEGTLQFDREVDLFVAPDAKIGNVVGAKAQAYTPGK